MNIQKFFMFVVFFGVSIASQSRCFDVTNTNSATSRYDTYSPEDLLLNIENANQRFLDRNIQLENLVTQIENTLGMLSEIDQNGRRSNGTIITEDYLITLITRSAALMEDVDQHLRNNDAFGFSANQIHRLQGIQDEAHRRYLTYWDAAARFHFANKQVHRNTVFKLIFNNAIKFNLPLAIVRLLRNYGNLFHNDFLLSELNYALQLSRINPAAEFIKHLVDHRNFDFSAYLDKIGRDSKQGRRFNKALVAAGLA